MDNTDILSLEFALCRHAAVEHKLCIGISSGGLGMIDVIVFETLIPRAEQPLNRRETRVHTVGVMHGTPMGHGARRPFLH